MRRLAQGIFLLTAVCMLLASAERALAGAIAVATYDGILALVALLAYLILRAGDMFDMIEVWLDRYELVVFERDEEDEPMVTWDRERFVGHYMAMPHCWTREEAEYCYDQNVRRQEDENGSGSDPAGRGAPEQGQGRPGGRG